MAKCKLSLEEWKGLGDKTKQLRECFSEIVTKMKGTMPKTKFHSAIHNIDNGITSLKSQLEEQLLKEHPELKEEYSRYFYGDN